jgi:hypothetical protein
VEYSVLLESLSNKMLASPVWLPLLLAFVGMEKDCGYEGAGFQKGGIIVVQWDCGSSTFIFLFESLMLPCCTGM